MNQLFNRQIEPSNKIKFKFNNLNFLNINYYYYHHHWIIMNNKIKENLHLYFILRNLLFFTILVNRNWKNFTSFFHLDHHKSIWIKICWSNVKMYFHLYMILNREKYKFKQTKQKNNKMITKNKKKIKRNKSSNFFAFNGHRCRQRFNIFCFILFCS